MDRTFPGLPLPLPEVLGTKVGRLVAAEFARHQGIMDSPGSDNPAGSQRWAADRFVRFGATRGLQIRKPAGSSKPLAQR